MKEQGNYKNRKSTTMTLVGTCSSETSVNLYWTSHIPEHSNSRVHSRDKLRSQMKLLIINFLHPSPLAGELLIHLRGKRN
jgi:hypothetical protein